MISRLNTLPRAVDPTIADFSWSATGPPFTFTIDGFVYAPGINEVVIFTPVQFDAVDSDNHGYPKVLTPPGVDVIQYHWDLDDGTIAYGDRPVHTFVSASPSLEVTLRVLDSRGLWSTVTKAIPIASAALGRSAIVGYKIRH